MFSSQICLFFQLVNIVEKEIGSWECVTDTVVCEVRILGAG